jgi:hypothetical protein
MQMVPTIWPKWMSCRSPMNTGPRVTASVKKHDGPVPPCDHLPTAPKHPSLLRQRIDQERQPTIGDDDFRVRALGQLLEGFDTAQRQNLIRQALGQDAL